MAEYHQPVLLEEVRALLHIRPGDIVVDCNLGTGGHSLALIEDGEGKGFLVGLDRDPDMLQLALDRFISCGIPSSSYALVHADHADLTRVLGDLGLDHANKILMDLGASSLHFDSARGFSCGVDGPLDMRYDRTAGATAAEIVNTWPHGELARLFKTKGDERWAGRIAKFLIARRRERPFETTADLAETVGNAIPRKAWPPKIHPATRVFLALRVEVNGEDESLVRGLDAGIEALADSGRMAVITFQSHEDRTVKRRFREACRDVVDETDPWGRVIRPAIGRDLTRKPIRPSSEEQDRNPRSRSAKLRGIEKLSIEAGKEE